MNKIRTFIFIMTSFFIILSGCKKAVDLGIGPIGDISAPSLTEKCKILSLVRTEGNAVGLSIQIIYNEKGPAFISGFNDFNEFIYENDQLVGAKNSNGGDYQILFEFDNQEQLTSVNFKGRDGAGVAFENISRLTYNGNGQLEKLSLSLPTFTQAVDLNFEYDGNGNVIKVSKKVNNGFETLLENLVFDNKKSPFLDQKLGQIMSYFMAYTLLVGDANYTYFLNKNNVIQSIITNNSGRIELNADYDYNNEDYATKANITRLYEGRLKSIKESFTFICE